MPHDDALIHLRVPAATKARWVRASRAAGLRLTDYISRAVEDAGGAPDPVAEDLIAEARLEDERGGGISYKPGRA